MSPPEPPHRASALDVQPDLDSDLEYQWLRSRKGQTLRIRAKLGHPGCPLQPTCPIYNQPIRSSSSRDRVGIVKEEGGVLCL